MKFVIDAHLPPGIVRLLSEAGHDAIHASALPDDNRSSDEQINQVSVTENRVAISKDIDFYNSLVLHSRPWKLVLIRTGNIGSCDLVDLLEKRLSEIVDALEENSLVELTRTDLHSAP
jgi:predicted nuclease of predicted toxin-antitoxin system